MPTCPRETENQGQQLLGANQGQRERFVTKQGRKERGWIKHPSPLHLMHCNHLDSRINEEMTYEQCPPSSYLSVKAF